MLPIRVAVFLLILIHVINSLKLEKYSNLTTQKPAAAKKRSKTDKIRSKVSSTKRSLLSYVGKKRTVEREASNTVVKEKILYGSMLKLKCTSDETDIQWSQDGEVYENSLYNWRIEVTDEGVLEIWPITQNDSGRWECSAKGRYAGGIEIEVLTLKESYVAGMIGYFSASALFLPLFLFGVFCLSHRHIDPPPKEFDPIVDLLTKQVNGAQFKERMGEENADAVVGAGDVKIRKKSNGVQTINMMLDVK